MRTRLLFAVIFGFLAGVFARSFFPLGYSVAGFAVLIAAVACAFAYLDEQKRKSLIIFAVALVAFAGGVLRMNSVVLVGDPELTSRLNKEIILEGMVSEEPDVRESNIRISLKADKLVLGTSPVRSLAHARAPEAPL